MSEYLSIDIKKSVIVAYLDQKQRNDFCVPLSYIFDHIEENKVLKSKISDLEDDFCSFYRSPYLDKLYDYLFLHLDIQFPDNKLRFEDLEDFLNINELSEEEFLIRFFYVYENGDIKH